MTGELSTFIKHRRKILGLTQQEAASRAGVGLRFIRELEQGKESLRLDKVNQVLALFGHKVGPISDTDKSELEKIQKLLAYQKTLIQGEV